MTKIDTKIILLEDINKSASKQFVEAGYTNIECYQNPMGQHELIEKIKGVRFLGIRSRTEITRKILRHPNAASLSAIGCFCIGTNQVDLKTAKERDIAVFNEPHANARPVAEMVIAETIFLLRRFMQKNALMHQGYWNKTAEGAHVVHGKKLGIIGYGNSGSQVSIFAESLGMDVYYYDTEKRLSIGKAKSCRSLDELLEIADILTLHVPHTPNTIGLIGKQELCSMKRGTYLINTSRGSVVDLDSLIELLENEHIAGAGLDVFPQEPEFNNAKFYSKLQNMKNVILTPHIGGSTIESQEEIGIEVARKLICFDQCSHQAKEVTAPIQSRVMENT